MASTDRLSYIRQVSPDRREGHLLSLMMITNPPEGGEEYGQVHPVFVEFTIAAYMAWQDFEHRRGDILPHLPELLSDCDFHWSFEARDTVMSPSHAVNELLQSWDVEEEEDNEVEGRVFLCIQGDCDSNSPSTESQQQQQEKKKHLPPFGIAGNLFSSITAQVTTLSSALEIPQISGTATSMELEKTDGLFARTVPTNAQDAQAVMTYYNSLGVTRVASVFINEPYGIQYHKALKEEANRLGITMVSFPMERGKIDESMQMLKESEARYVFAIVLENDWQMIFQSAYNHQVMGDPDHSWIAPDLTYFLSSAFALDKETESDLAQAMQGLGVIYLHLESPAQTKFDQALQSLTHDEERLQDFIQHAAYPEIFSNFTPPAQASPFLYHHLVYDSVIALGLAACATPGEFTGTELFQQLLQTKFEGVSGNVSFANTGTRDSITTQYRLDNILLSDTKSTATEYKLDVAESVSIRGKEVYEIWPFQYPNNSTIPPLDLPPVEGYDNHLVPKGILVAGYTLAAAVLFLSVVTTLWTICRRKSFVISAAQPAFLLQLLLGVALMALSIFSLGMQGEESTPQLDRACMSIPWLLFVGFVIALAALMSKTWRISQIMGGTEGLKRLKVSTKDVMAPLFILLPFNVTMLTAWTLVSPYQYVRVSIENVDAFARELESYGTCQCPNNWVWLFASLMCFANWLGVLFVALQCYRTRNVSQFFSETYYLGLSLASLTETALLGGPLIFLVKDNPSAFFMVASALVFIVCMSFLIPIFGFKFTHSDAIYEDAKIDMELREAQDMYAFNPGESAAPDADNLNVNIPGHMSLRRVKNLDALDLDDDSVGGCSFRSGRSARSRNTTRSTKTKSSMLSKKSSRFFRNLKRMSSSSNSKKHRELVSELSANSAHEFNPGKMRIPECRASQEHSSRPMSMSFTALKRGSKATQDTSRAFTVSDARRSTLNTLSPPIQVSFSNLDDSLLSEAFTEDGSGEGGHGHASRPSHRFSTISAFSNDTLSEVSEEEEESQSAAAFSNNDVSSSG